MDLKKLLQPKFLIIGGVAVIGGLFLASKLRPKEKSSGEDTEVVATPILQPYGVDRNPDEYRADTPTTLPGTPGTPQPPKATNPMPAPVPVPTKPPVQPVPPVVTRPPVPLPEMPGKGQPLPGQPAPSLPGTPRRDVPPPPRTTPPVTPSVPGGTSNDCRGVQPRPADHPGTDINRLVVAKGNDARARAYALEWVYMGIANSGATGLSRFTNWITQPAIWPRVNATRRARGLRAYTETEFKTLTQELHQLNATNMGKDDKLTVAQLQVLWQKWHVPYLCS